MRLERIVVHKMRGIEHVEVSFNSTATVIHGGSAQDRRTILHAIAIGLALYNHPERNGPSKGCSKGQTDQPAFNVDDVRNAAHNPAVEMITAGESHWTRYRDRNSGRTETEIHRLVDQHKCVLTALNENTRKSARSIAETIAEDCRKWWPTAIEPEAAAAIALIGDIDRENPVTTAKTLEELRERFSKLQVIATSQATPAGVATENTIELPVQLQKDGS